MEIVTADIGGTNARFAIAKHPAQFVAVAHTGRQQALERIFRRSAQPATTATGIDISGTAIRRATEAVGKHSGRVSLVLKADIRPGFTGQLEAKVERVEQHLTKG